VADGIPSSSGHPSRSRTSERAAVERLLQATLAGRGGAIVIRGEAGIGKTELLEEALETVPGLRQRRVAGRESETELLFTALHELCKPMLMHLEPLPGPQRASLEVAFALRDGAEPDRFRVGLALLGLLSEAAHEQPVVCVVDDAQWLDHASAQVLAFVARRVESVPVAFLFALREPAESGMLEGLPTQTLTGLGIDDARALLTSQFRVPLDERIRDQIIAEARGNPLVLLELSQRVGSAELAGGYGLPDTLSVPDRIEAGTLARLTGLPAETRRLLLVAAAEPLGDPVLLWRACERLGIGSDAAVPAEAAGLLDLGVRLRFRHPLVRSTIYRAASPEDRRAAHRALADVTDAGLDPDRRAWHRGRSVYVPDEAVAEELERSADRALACGGMAAAAGFLERATALTPDPARRAARALAAARFKHRAGDVEAASGLLATAEAGPLDARQRALADLLSAEIAARTVQDHPAPDLLLDAAKILEAHDRPLARETYLEGLAAAMRVGRFGAPKLLEETALNVRAALDRVGPLSPTRPIDLLLDALTEHVIHGRAKAVPLMRTALSASLDEGGDQRGGGQWIWLACSAAADLWDEQAMRTLAERQVDLSRRAGALIPLSNALRILVLAHIHAGEFDSAQALIDDANAVLGPAATIHTVWVDLLLGAWRGQAERVQPLIKTGLEAARERAEGRVATTIGYADAVLHNGVGRYDVALRAARTACLHDEHGFSSLLPPELVEAAARTGQPQLAEPVLDQLIEQTEACGTDWAIGVQLRSRALLSEGDQAEEMYREAIDRLQRTTGVVHLARAHLVYGEWLRREARRADARIHLRMAYESLTEIGAAGFAARAAAELSTCGDRPRKPATTPLDLLTVQERRIALLVADGATRKEAAGQLFLSPRTVDAHLRSIFKKLGLTSRRQLHDLRLADLREPSPSRPA
jgi:DNA-binding CsgD family transcriptional regulator